MQVKIFKKTVNEFLESKNFKKKGACYYCYVTDLIIIIALQKSSYGNGYYINISYVIPSLNPLIEHPRDVDGDVRARFSFLSNEKKTDYCDLDNLLDSDLDMLTEQLKDNCTIYVEPITGLDKLKILLQDKPVMLYQTKLIAKQLLGFE